jgi:hypothetical protein
LDEPSSGAISMDPMPMTTLASQVSFTFDVNDVFLINKMEIDHEKKNKVKISNLKPLAPSL